jgi:uncharacterized membrane protein YccF (DUF307 family)
MAKARQEYQGLLSAWHAAAVIAHLPFTAARLSPRAINPFGAPAVASEALQQVREARARTMMAVAAIEGFRMAGKELPGVQ